MTNQFSFSHEQSCHTQNIFELYYTRSSSLFDCQWITRESTVHCIGWGLNKMECFIIKKMSTYASYAFLGEHTNELGLIIMLSGNRYLFFIIKSKKFHNNNFLLALGAIDKKLSSRFADFGLPQTLQGQNQILQIFVSLVLFVSCFICFLTAVYAFLTCVFFTRNLEFNC